MQHKIFVFYLLIYFTVKISDSCETDADCTLKGSVCTANKCVCMLGYARLKHECVSSKLQV